MTNAFGNMAPDEWPDLTAEETAEVFEIVATVGEMTTDDNPLPGTENY